MKLLVVLLSFMLIPLSHAATLQGRNGIELLAVDGQKVSAGMLQSKELELSDGHHQIVVRFSKRFNQKNMVNSKPHIFSTDIKGDTTITVRNFANAAQAEYAIRQGVTWIVKNDHGTTKIAESDILFAEGFQLKTDLEKLIANYNHKGSGASLEHPSEVSIDSIAQQGMSSKTEQLIAIYRSASLEERKSFRLWLLEQDIK